MFSVIRRWCERMVMTCARAHGLCMGTWLVQVMMLCEWGLRNGSWLAHFRPAHASVLLGRHVHVMMFAPGSMPKRDHGLRFGSLRIAGFLLGGLRKSWWGRRCEHSYV